MGGMNKALKPLFTGIMKTYESVDNQLIQYQQSRLTDQTFISDMKTLNNFNNLKTTDPIQLQIKQYAGN
jgi:hypothetical protein